ncbi:hypothetical protein PoB_007493400 [Plakobranchus ocellatus]|uniref:Uncharacterized protein n=1 Tax=Plakobranchus ocellatus TaxID=259542 RepID=A0AAV4DW52_9GAST|nr:hypothetical protein PoB_007493400 [Plakobranchus ocellatus]
MVCYPGASTYTFKSLWSRIGHSPQDCVGYNYEDKPGAKILNQERLPPPCVREDERVAEHVRNLHNVHQAGKCSAIKTLVRANAATVGGSLLRPGVQQQEQQQMGGGSGNKRVNQ